MGNALIKYLSKGKEKLYNITPSHGLYKTISDEVKDILSTYDPHLRCYSLDEMFMELKPYLKLRLEQGLSHEDIQEVWKEREEKGWVNVDDENEKKTKNNNKIINSSSSNNLESAYDSNDDEEEDDNYLLAGPQQPNLKTNNVLTSSIEDIVFEMRKKVKEKTFCSCSCGIASNFLLAKIASDVNKPDGQCYLQPDNNK